tara:strand:+ start:725 stop:1024 length:300 start_codon:yes stop_codon:yes gene_type:complete
MCYIRSINRIKVVVMSNKKEKNKKTVFKDLLSEIKGFRKGLIRAGSELGMFSASSRDESATKKKVKKDQKNVMSPEAMREIEVKIADEVTQKGTRKMVS